MSLNKTMHELSGTVHKLSRVLSDYVRHQMELEGINDIHPSAEMVLLPLLQKEGQTLSDLAKDLHMKAPTITVIANRLENLGWIRRRRGTHDRRQVHLFLTPEGREKANQLAGIHRKAFQTMAANISRESLHMTTNTLNQIINNVFPIIS
jgi:DNA-binding MarR family transcriptional regulator